MLIQFERRKIMIMGIFVLISCLFSIFFVDQKISNLLSPEQALQVYQPARTLTDVGEGAHFFAIAIIGYLICLALLRWKTNKVPFQDLQKIEKAKSWFLTFFLALLSSGVVLQMIKFIVGRQRPHLTAERDPLVFDHLTSNWHLHSFPSGHTQTLFTVATACSLTFPKWRWWFFAIAALIAMTRVLLQEHFFSDLLMGAYIGYAITLLVFFYRQKARN